MSRVRMVTWPTAVWATAWLLLCAGCTRGPGEAALRAEVQEKLNRQFEPGLFELALLKRQGSAPLPAAPSGASRLAVYFNASIRLAKDYRFGDWEGLGPASLAQVLGATEKGLAGINPQQNRKSDVLHVYGSSIYERSGEVWQSVAFTTDRAASASEPGNAAPPSRSQQLLQQLASKVNLPPPGPNPAEERVIAEELDRALATIARRLERQKKVLALAGGPAGGEYSRIGEAAVRRIVQVLGQERVRLLQTQGSVENAWLLTRGEADFALMQSDVAALAAVGEGPFARHGPVASLRALASLFPEPVHIIVPVGSPIENVAGLRGKRVGIGQADSGTYQNAVAVLRAHGLDSPDLAVANRDGTSDALAQIQAGALDAAFVTIAAPTHELQALATRAGMRLLSLGEKAIERILAERPGLVRLTLRANTYPGQVTDVRTVAATALLVATDNTLDSEVALLLKVIFEGADYQAVGSGQGAKVSRRTALRGVTIPMHPGADRYLSGGSP